MWENPVMPASRDGKYRRPLWAGRAINSIELPLGSVNMIAESTQRCSHSSRVAARPRGMPRVVQCGASGIEFCA